MELETYFDWLKLITSEDGFYREKNITAKMYGEGDASYMVFEMEKSTSPKIIDQYTIHVVDNSNKLYGLTKFIAENNFSLTDILERIVSADYIEESMNDIAKINGVEVARYTLKEN